MMGRIMKIDRGAVATLSGGTCSSPSFIPSADAATLRIQVSCVGQALATAQWDAATPDTVNWSESDVRVVLRRVTGAGDSQ